MSEFMWGVLTKPMPTAAEAARWDRICREEGGYGYTEVNRVRGSTPGINSGYYQGWFSGPNRGNPFDQAMAERVAARIARPAPYYPEPTRNMDPMTRWRA